MSPPTIPDTRSGRRARLVKGKPECFEADPDYVRSANPKYVKFNDGHRERYDPNKHTR